MAVFQLSVTGKKSSERWKAISIVFQGLDVLPQWLLRTIVENDELPVVLPIPPHRFDRLRDERGSVVRRNDNRNEYVLSANPFDDLGLWRQTTEKPIVFLKSETQF